MFEIDLPLSFPLLQGVSLLIHLNKGSVTTLPVVGMPTAWHTQSTRVRSDADGRNGGLTHGTSFDSHIAEVHQSRTCRANEIGKVRWYADAVGGYVHDMVVEVNETWC